MTSNQFDIEPYSRPLNDSFALGFKMQRVYFRCQKNKTQNPKKPYVCYTLVRVGVFTMRIPIELQQLVFYTGNFFSETRTVMRNFQFLLDPKIFTRSMQKSNSSICSQFFIIAKHGGKNACHSVEKNKSSSIHEHRILLTMSQTMYK